MTTQCFSKHRPVPVGGGWRAEWSAVVWARVPGEGQEGDAGRVPGAAVGLPARRFAPHSSGQANAPTAFLPQIPAMCPAGTSPDRHGSCINIVSADRSPLATSAQLGHPGRAARGRHIMSTFPLLPAVLAGLACSRGGVGRRWHRPCPGQDLSNARCCCGEHGHLAVSAPSHPQSPRDSLAQTHAHACSDADREGTGRTGRKRARVHTRSQGSGRIQNHGSLEVCESPG